MAKANLINWLHYPDLKVGAIPNNKRALATSYNILNQFNLSQIISVFVFHSFFVNLHMKNLYLFDSKHHLIKQFLPIYLLLKVRSNGLKWLVLPLLFFNTLSGFSQLKTENKLLVGRLELSEKQYESAIQKFNYVIENYPPNYEPYYYRGIAKIELGDVAGAEMDFTEAIKLRPLKTDLYIIRGSARERLKNYDGAFEDFNKALELNPINPDIYLNRALVYSYLNQYDKAIDDCNKAIHYGSRKELTYIIRGMSKLGNKQYREAIADFDLILENNKFNASSYVRKATAYYYLGNYDTAQTNIQIALQIEPENTYAYFQQAMIFIKLEQNDEALKSLSKVISISPESATAYYNRAILYAEKNDYKNALKDYDKVIFLSPSNILAFYNRAAIFNQLKKYKESLADVEQAIALYPDFVDGYKLRSNIYRQLGNISKAETDLETAQLINQTKSNATDSLKEVEEAFLARLTSFSDNTNENVTKYSDQTISLSSPYYISLLAQNKNKQVIDSWNESYKSYTPYFVLKMEDEEILDIPLKEKKLRFINDKISKNPNNAELYIQRGVIYASLKQHEKAILEFNKSLHIDKNYYLAYFARANLFHQMLNESENSTINIDMIIKDYDKAIALNPDFKYAAFNRGILYFQLSKYINAIEDFSVAIELDNSFSEAYLNRGLILLILNNHEQACKDLSRAGELGLGSVYLLINRYCN